MIIIHVDMDAFFAAVEIRDDPGLRGKPLIIGSLPNERGVVATCSYEARKYGVHSAMNIKDAYRLCPNGIYMHPHMDKYKAVSDALHVIWSDYAAALESVAYDEAYLDVTARAKDFDGAREIAREIKRRTREELGLSCSVGVAYSKTAAKTASEEKKPNGYFEILTPEAFTALMSGRDVRELYTVGKKTAEKLHRSGIRTVRDITLRSGEVVSLLGKQGQWLVSLASGIDDRPVTPYRPEDAKSIGREVTFQKDVDNYALLSDVLLLLALSVDRRAKRVGLHGKGVSLKITYADMKSISRSQLVFSTDSPLEIYRTAARLLGSVEHRPARLVGVSIYNLSAEPEPQISIDELIEEKTHRSENELSALLDSLGARYGLDFAGNLDKIYKADTLHKTIEYMRRHS
ncbi:MAG: DNA polymerase IV [Oscillospiraceae bacterium]|nr:DNA polymerase IV [Oscillospiraceae bacterium]